MTIQSEVGWATREPLGTPCDHALDTPRAEAAGPTKGRSRRSAPQAPPPAGRLECRRDAPAVDHARGARPLVAFRTRLRPAHGADDHHRRPWSLGRGGGCLDPCTERQRPRRGLKGRARGRRRRRPARPLPPEQDRDLQRSAVRRAPARAATWSGIGACRWLVPRLDGHGRRPVLHLPRQALDPRRDHADGRQAPALGRLRRQRRQRQPQGRRRRQRKGRQRRLRRLQRRGPRSA